MRLRETGRRRLLCFDVENRPLAYWYPGETTGEITALGWKWHDEPVAHALLLRRDGRFQADDGRTLSAFRAFARFRSILVEAGVIYGHNIRRHDLPLVQAACLRLVHAPLPPLLTSDTLSDYPRRRYMSASLENLARLYGLEGEKLHMSQADWEQANRLAPDGLALTRERVVSDVLLQEQLRDRLLAEGLLREPRTWRP